MSADLTYERAAELLDYDPESGILTWIAKPSVTAHSVKVGAGAGSLSKDGYLRIRIDGKKYQAHRLAWLLHTGEFPPDQIDHINGIRTDNRIANLRSATSQQNNQNAGKKRSNTSGYKGVNLHKQSGKWVARIRVPLLGQCSLGYFDTPEAAAAMYAGAAALFHADYCHIETVNIHIHLTQQGESPQ